MSEIGGDVKLDTVVQGNRRRVLPPAGGGKKDEDCRGGPHSSIMTRAGTYDGIMRLVMIAAIALPLLAESVAGLKWTTPAGWKNDGIARPMRAATYLVSDGAECVVYFFGAGLGGPVQANLDRWKGQMLAPDGKTAEAKIDKRTVHGLTVTTIDSSGEYTGMGGPMAPGKPVKGYRLLGAIVEGPGGNVFIKFTGPQKAVTANRAKFEELVDSFERQH